MKEEVNRLPCLATRPKIANVVEKLANNKALPDDYRRLMVNMLLHPHEPLPHQATKLFDLVTLRVRFFKPSRVNAMMLRLYKVIQ